MLTIVITKQELGPEEASSDTDQDVESEERGELRPPSPELSRLLNDQHSDEGEDRDEAVELERRMFEVTSGELVVVSLDVVGAVRRQWAEVGIAAPGGMAPGSTDVVLTPGNAGSANGWRFTIAGATRSW